MCVFVRVSEPIETDSTHLDQNRNYGAVTELKRTKKFTNSRCQIDPTPTRERCRSDCLISEFQIRPLMDLTISYIGDVSIRNLLDYEGTTKRDRLRRPCRARLVLVTLSKTCLPELINWLSLSFVTVLRWGENFPQLFYKIKENFEGKCPRPQGAESCFKDLLSSSPWAAFETEIPPKSLKIHTF